MLVEKGDFTLQVYEGRIFEAPDGLPNSPAQEGYCVTLRVLHGGKALPRVSVYVVDALDGMLELCGETDDAGIIRHRRFFKNRRKEMRLLFTIDGVPGEHLVWLYRSESSSE